jgi:tetratricopeptide (TPR) repeat protein
MNAYLILFLCLGIFLVIFILAFPFLEQQQVKSFVHNNQTSTKNDTNYINIQEKAKLNNQTKISVMLNDALKLYNKALSFQPNATDILSNKGMLLIKMQKYDEAIKVFDKVLDLDPNNVAGLYNKGVSLEKLGNAYEADKYHKAALKINPSYKPEFLNRLSLSLSVDKPESGIIENLNIKNKSNIIK